MTFICAAALDVLDAEVKKPSAFQRFASVLILRVDGENGVDVNVLSCLSECDGSWMAKGKDLPTTMNVVGKSLGASHVVPDLGTESGLFGPGGWSMRQHRQRN